MRIDVFENKEHARQKDVLVEGFENGGVGWMDEHLVSLLAC